MQVFKKILYQKELRSLQRRSWGGGHFRGHQGPDHLSKWQSRQSAEKNGEKLTRWKCSLSASRAHHHADNFGILAEANLVPASTSRGKLENQAFVRSFGTSMLWNVWDNSNENDNYLAKKTLNRLFCCGAAADQLKAHQKSGREVRRMRF